MAAPEPAIPASGRVASEAGLGAPIALAVCLALAAFGVVGSLTHLILPATELPPPFPNQHQDAETLTFVFTFALALPAALLLTNRLAARLTGAQLAGLGSALSVALLAATLAIKAADVLGSVDGATALLVAAAAWWSLALYLLASARLGHPGVLERLGEETGRAWTLAAALAVAVVLCFFDVGALALQPLGIGLIGTAAILYGYARGVGGLLRIAGRGGALIDAAIVLLLLFAVPNLMVFDTSNLFQLRIIQFHQDFFLGPANHVLEGGAMLVDTLSQYGVASIYLLVGWFQIAPIGNGTLGFLDNVLSALVFVAAYGVLRLVGVSRLLAAATMTVAVVVLVYGLEYPLGALLQHGAIRFGIPMLLIAAATVEFARPALRRPAQVIELLTVGLSAIWALEAFAYTVLTAAAILAVRLWLTPRPARRRTLLRWAGASLAAIAGFHVALVLGTLIAVGEVPDWGWYLNTLREFLTGSVGDLTYDFAPWTAAFAVGSFYVAATAALVLLARNRPGLARQPPARIVALAATTAWGVALFSYFVNRSAEHILPYVCLPVVMLVAIWLGLLLERRTGLGLRLRLGGLGAVLAVTALLIAAAWPQAGTRFSQSALAYAVPGGGSSLSEGLDRLWNPPDLSPGASAGAALIERCMPDPDRTYVLTDADLGIEMLTKVGRANAFPLGDPWEDSFVPDAQLEHLEQSIDGLRPGDRLLVDAPALATYDAYRVDPGRDPLTDPIGEERIVPTGLAKLQEWLLKEIGTRYRLETICRASGPSGLRVVTLEPRRGPPVAP